MGVLVQTFDSCSHLEHVVYVPIGQGELPFPSALEAKLLPMPHEGDMAPHTLHPHVEVPGGWGMGDGGWNIRGLHWNGGGLGGCIGISDQSAVQALWSVASEELMGDGGWWMGDGGWIASEELFTVLSYTDSLARRLR